MPRPARPPASGAVDATGAVGALVLGCLLAAVVGLSLAASGAAAADAGQANVTVVTESSDGVVSVDVRITNEGDATGRYGVELVAEDHGVVAERDLRVPPNGTRQAAFDVEASGTTTFALYVNSVEVDRFTVTAPVESTATDDRRLPGPIVVGLLGGVVILVAGAVLFRLT